jgi:prolyl-tRNA editing enzyme YbaK/EbsC (Cys-tRNA(Pro) deacylase)
MSSLDPVVQQHVDAAGIRHELIECNPDWADTEVFCANYDIPKSNAANTILVAAKTEPRTYFACLVLATTKIDVNHKLSKVAGIKRMSFATAEETKAVTGQLIGGVTVFGLPDSLTIYVDRAVMNAEYAIVGGGNRSTKLSIAPAELLKLPNVRVEDIAVARTP